MFITFDGPNGAGKTTLIENIAQKLIIDYTVYKTTEPTQDAFGQYVRNNEGDLHGMSYMYLIAANRSEHIQKEILPHNNNKEIILCDRYIASGLALQKAEGVPFERTWDVNKHFPQPDIAFIVSASASELESRLNLRKQKTFFELSLTRQKEIDLYKEAYNFLLNQGNIVFWIDNSQDKYISNVNMVYRIIKQYMEE